MPSKDDLTGGQFQHREYRDLKPAAPKPPLPKAVPTRPNIQANRPCPICNGTGWNHGAQPGPGPGYKTVTCSCVSPNAPAQPTVAPAQRPE